MADSLKMTRQDFLDAIKDFTEEIFRDVRLPKNIDPDEILDEDPDDLFREDGEMVGLAVYKMRLPDTKSNVAAAPYCLHQIVTGNDGYDEHGAPKSTVLLRSVFCIYHPMPSSEEALALSMDPGADRVMEVAERFRISVLRDGIIANRYELDMTEGDMETLYYPDDMRPYYIAEVASVWKVPPVKREYRQYLKV